MKLFPKSLALVLFVPLLSAMQVELASEITRAVQENNPQLLSDLADRGADLSVPLIYDADGDKVFVRNVTPLLFATRLNHTECVQVLLARGVPVNTSFNWENNDERAEVYGSTLGCSALHIACEYGYVALAELLIRSGADVNARNAPGHRPLHNAASRGHTALVKLLVEHGAEVVGDAEHCWGTQSVSQGIFSFRSTSHGAPLCCAVEAQDLEAVEFLLQQDVPVDSKSLASAYSHGNERLIDLLRSNGATLTKLYPSVLIDPARKGRISLVRLLIATGMSLEGKDSIGTGATPLICAAYNGHPETVRLLLEAGAFLHAKNRHGHTALECARRGRNLCILDVLTLPHRPNLSQEGRLDVLRSLQKLPRYPEVIELLESYQFNPLSLKDICLNAVRKYMQQGIILNERLPELDMFGLVHLLEPKEEDSCTNDEEVR